MRFLIGVLLAGALMAQAPPARTRAFTVEEKAPAEALEAAPGVAERYALLIGISKYANPTLSLSFAANDAQALHKLLLDPEIGAYKPENVRLLVDEQATRKNVLSSLSTWLGNRTRENDSVLIFYSGHGALGNGNEAYWGTHDADAEDLAASALSNKEISTLIANLPVKRKITLIDSCYSEATAKKYRALVPTNLFDQFKGKGVVTITASSGQEKSVEVAGHGAFTYHLLDGLAGKADTNTNGVVEIDEVWKYLDEKVQKTAADAGNKQTPVLMAERMEHGFPVTMNPSRTANTLLGALKGLYADGALSLDEMAEAERVLVKREGGPEMRNLYRGLAEKSLTVPYFRQLRGVLTARPDVPAATVVAAAAGPAAMPVAGSPPGATGAELEAFRIAEAGASMDSWIRFLQQFPQGFLAASARTRLDELDKKKLEEAAYTLAKRSDNEKVWEQFLGLYPNGSHVQEAERRTTELRQQREAEVNAYRVAESRNAESAWVRFLKEYPTGALAVVAEDRLETMRRVAREKEDQSYAQAVRSNVIADWDAYIAEYPTGRFIEDAAKKRAEAYKQLEEERERKAHEDLYAAARTGDSVESWSAYLAKYPKSPHAPAAAARLDQLKWLAFADVVPIPAGAFAMGSERQKDEKPPHRIELDTFLIGRSEIANAQYMRFLIETNYRRPAPPSFNKNYLNGHPDLPAVGVSYEDAAAFCQWLSKKVGTTVRLPTEAEWEYAAAAGKDNMLYPWGAQPPASKARFKDNASGDVKTVAAKVYPPNGLGLLNAAGNVAEWVSDWYSETYYRLAPKKAPPGPAGGRERVVRGGSWKSN